MTKNTNNPQHLNPIRSYEETETHTLYRYVGFPYGGQVKNPESEDGTDFHGTFFSSRTDFGPPERQFEALFEHGRFEGVDFVPMGTARFLEETDQGRLVEIAVAKSNKYHNFLRRLYDLGILYGSGQAYKSGYVVDPDTHEIIRFIPAEYSFAIAPSNTRAVPAGNPEVVTAFADPIGVARSVLEEILEEREMNKKKKTAADQQPNVDETVDEGVEEEQGADAADQTEDSSARSVADEVAEILNSDNEGDNNNVVLYAVQGLARSVQTLLDEMKVLREQSEATSRSIDELAETRIAAIETAINDNAEATKLVARSVSESVQDTVLAAAVQMSGDEATIYERSLSTQKKRTPPPADNPTPDTGGSSVYDHLPILQQFLDAEE